MQTVTDWTVELYSCGVVNLLLLIMLHCVLQIPLTTQMNTCGSCRQGWPVFLESDLWVYARLLTRGKVFSLSLSLSNFDLHYTNTGGILRALGAYLAQRQTLTRPQIL